MNNESALGKEWINKILNDQTDLQNKVFSLEEENKRLKDLLHNDNINDNSIYKNLLYNMLRCGSISREHKDYFDEIRLSIDSYPLFGNELDLINNLFYEIQSKDPSLFLSNKYTNKYSMTNKYDSENINNWLFK